MKRAFAAFSAASLLFFSARRCPAPIAEETPTPAPTSTAMTTPLASVPAKQNAARFAGTWTGKIKFAMNMNEMDYTLMVNQEATSLILKSPRIGEYARPTTINAGALSWKAGPHDGNLWTLTPNPDGQTATVKVKPGANPEVTATFQRAKPMTLPPNGAGVRPRTHQ
jgi:hypothetical protein